MRTGPAFLTVLFVSAGAALIPREAAAQGHGVITGRIVDERGDPVVDATVVAWAPTMGSGYRRSSHDAETRSDDRGIYRLHSLRHRRYVVCVVPGFQPPPRGEVDPVRGFAPVCYADAKGTRVTIELAAGEERAGVDFRLARTRLARTEGTVVGLALATGEDATLQLVNEDQELGDVRIAVGVPPSRRFVFRDVPPGRYALVMTVRERVRWPAPTRDLAAMSIVVGDADLHGLELTVPKPASVAGYRLAIGYSSADGDYVVNGLRAGTYRVATLPHVEFAAWFEPGFFDALDPTATTVSIVGEGQTILTVRGRSPDR